MKISRVAIRNFMPYFGSNELHFPTDDFKNVVLVFGDNMRGKTSLMNAIRWAFYAAAVDRYSQEIPLERLVNSDAAGEGDWEVSVGVDFEHEGRAYELRRTARKRPGIGRPQRREDFLVEESLRMDGSVVRGDLVVETINRVVPKQISRFFLFDGELLQEYEALLAEENEQGRRIKEAIEQVLGVPALIKGKADLKILRKPFDKQWQQDLKQNGAVKTFSERLTALEKEADLLEQDRIAQDEALARQRRSHSALQEQIDETQAQFAQKAEMDVKKARLKQIEQEKETLDQRKLQALKGAWLDMLRPRFSKALEDVQKQIDVATERVRSGIRDDKTLLTSIIANRHCDVCLQTVGASAIEKLEERLARSEDSSSKTAIDQLADLNQFAKRLGSIQYPNAQLLTQEIEAAIGRLTVEETTLLDQVSTLREQLSSFDSEKMRSIRRDAENALAAIRALEQKLSETQLKIDENERNKEKQRLLIQSNAAARDQRSGKIVELVSKLEQCFSDAIERLREDLKSDVEARATKTFKSLTTDKTYTGLRINRNYGLKIIDESGREVPLRSAGAEQIVALSLIDALNQAGRSPGPVIMDTPFGRLDPKHRRNVLEHLPTSSAQVVLFVHEGEIDPTRDLEAVGSRIGAVFTLDRISSSRTSIRKGGGAA